jgi:hypothetical protein
VPGRGTVAWALDASLPLSVEDQVRALAEGAVVGGTTPAAGEAASRRPASSAS